MNVEQMLKDDLKQRTATFLLDLHAHLATELLDKGRMEPKEANDTAMDIVDHVRKTYGGETLYFPKGQELDATLRHHSIYKEFNGRNHASLAKKYGVSTQWVYSIIKEIDKRLKTEVQPDMFSAGAPQAQGKK